MSTVCQPAVNDGILHLVRVLLLVVLLTVGALNVTRCGNGNEDISSAARDQHDRMYRVERVSK